MNELKPAVKSLGITAPVIGAIIVIVEVASGFDLSKWKDPQTIASLAILITFVLSFIGRRDATKMIDTPKNRAKLEAQKNKGEPV